jgi:hypothetical protein
VAELRNPAGRLHALLSAFAQQKNKSTQAAWANVLQVSESEVPLYLNDVAALLRETRNAAMALERQAFDPIPEQLQALSRTIYPIDQGFNNPAAHVQPDVHAMRGLAMLSTYLEDLAPDGKLAGEDQRSDIRQTVCELINDVAAADLPTQIRRMLLTRLNEMLEALDHLQTGGPDAVRNAAEALAISALVYEADAESETTVFTRIRSVAYKAWVAYTVTTALAGSVLTWEKITGIDLLPAGQQQHQLPPASSDLPPPVDERAP